MRVLFVALGLSLAMACGGVVAPTPDSSQNSGPVIASKPVVNAGAPATSPVVGFLAAYGWQGDEPPGIRVGWSKMSGVQGYKAEVRIDSTSAWGTRKIIYGNRTTSIYYSTIERYDHHHNQTWDGRLIEGQCYHVRILAWNSAGEGPWSMPHPVTIPSVDSDKAWPEPQEPEPQEPEGSVSDGGENRGGPVPDTEPAATLPHMSITVNRMSYIEGEIIEFAVHAKPYFWIDRDIYVNIGYDHQNARLARSPPSQILFTSGLAGVLIRLHTTDDNRRTPSGTIRAKLLPGNGYRIAPPRAAEAHMIDND